MDHHFKRQQPVAELDLTDVRLITALMKDARLTRAELARRVGLSAPAVGERVRRLEETGVITGYRADVDPRRLGLPLTVLIRARPSPGMMDDMVAAIRATPYIVRCERVSGEDCFVATAHVPDVAAMERVIDKLIPFGSTNTSMVQSTTVAERTAALIAAFE